MSTRHRKPQGLNATEKAEVVTALVNTQAPLVAVLNDLAGRVEALEARLAERAP